ncbi:MAG: hypothetical protein GY733_05415 [bacterium]|nr:hypothetical protein [bacterium]
MSKAINKTPERPFPERSKPKGESRLIEAIENAKASISSIADSQLIEFARELSRYQAEQDYQELAAIAARWAEPSKFTCVIDDVRSLMHLSFVLFRQIAQRNARLDGPGHVADKDRTDEEPRHYFSVSYVRDPSYFNRSFIAQLSRQLDAAVATTLDAIAQEYPGWRPPNRPLVPTQRVVIIPEEYWPIGDCDRSGNFEHYWGSVVSILDRQNCPSPTWAADPFAASQKVDLYCVGEEVVRATGVPIDQLDFGLYGDVAVGIYRYEHERESIKLHLGRDTVDRCRGVWRSLFHEEMDCMSWERLKAEGNLIGHDDV